MSESAKRNQLELSDSLISFHCSQEWLNFEFLTKIYQPVISKHPILCVN
jgi:hypothetical protein